MTADSYSDVFSIDLDRPFDEEIWVGDVVRSGTNYFPHFEVIAISGDKAWLRDIQNGADHLAQLRRCRKLQRPILALAAE